MRRKKELLSRVKYQMKGEPMRVISKKRVAVALAALVLLAAPLSLYRGGLTAKQPAVSPAGSPAPVPGKDLKSITVSLQKGSKAKVGETSVDLEDLAELLEGQVTGDREKMVVHIDCDKNASMGFIYQVQKLLTEMDLRKVNFRGPGYEDMAIVLPPADIDDWLGKLREKNVVRLIVDKEGHALIDGEKIPHAKLQGVIEEHLSNNPNIVFTLESFGDTKYGAFLEALEKMKGAGAPRIVIVPPGE
jgi:biopolymer transport protein ExbD